MTLTTRGKRVSAILRANARGRHKVALSDLSQREVAEFSGFFDEIIEFGERLDDLSLSAIDIYYPGLKRELMMVVGSDCNFSYYYSKELAPKYGLESRPPPPALAAMLSNFGGDFQLRNWGRYLVSMLRGDTRDRVAYGPYRDRPIELTSNGFAKVVKSLEAIRKVLAEIVREHWDFRELSTPSGTLAVNLEGGLHMTETKYNVTNSQVAALGDNARVDNAVLNQRLEVASASLDLTALAEELDKLEKALAKTAKEREHYAALVAISDASKDARAGKREDALAKLKTTGVWLLEFARDIGVHVAAEGIKIALGT